MNQSNPWPMSNITDSLDVISVFQFATVVNFNTGYYSRTPGEDIQKLCTIVLPWGKFIYQGLPMIFLLTRVYYCGKLVHYSRT